MAISCTTWSPAKPKKLIWASDLQAQFYGNAKYPRLGSPWSMRLQLAFLFQKLTKAEEKKILEKKLKQLEQEQQSPKH